jgi:glycosyltransferase involved in cell wall biosynthesis
MSRPDLSVIIPAFNEAKRIECCIREVMSALGALDRPWELIVVDDGSTDATVALARAAAGSDTRVRIVGAPHLGKGGAVRHGMLAATGHLRLMTDADLATPLSALPQFLRADADIVIGSREGTGAVRIDEPWRRHAIGRLFNWIVKATVLRGIEDTQCGFKLFRAVAAEALFPHQRIDGFGFDVEILFLARRAGYAVVSVPVTWSYRSDSKVDAVSGVAGFLDVMRVRWNAWRGAYDGLSAKVPMSAPGAREVS